MNENDIPTTTYKAGFVSVMGRPNVGKSTLINTLLGQKIAAVSPRPQTTRKRQLGILTRENAQIVFVDTPGVHKALHKLGENMNKEAAETLQDSDVILFLVEANQKPQPEDLLLVDLLNSLKREIPIILALNKADLVDDEKLASNSAAYTALIPQAAPIALSATRQDNLPLLEDMILERLAENQPFFPADQVTDLYEREIAADLIREAALYILRDEVPHGIAIRIDQYQERGQNGAYIEATLFVERESHKPIVIGQGGQMLKKIGTMARQKIEQMSERKVFLQLKVKVRKNWRDDEKVLRWFGY
jgi:GTPase